MDGLNATIASDSSTKQKQKRDRNDAVGNWFFSFLSAPYFRDEFLRTGLLTETFETCVTWTRLKALHDDIGRKVKESIGRLFFEDCFFVLTKRFTHIYSDGVAIYFTLLIDPRKEWRKEYEGDYRGYLRALLNARVQLKNEIQLCVVRNGGSSTHHHAVGKDHAQSFVKEVGVQNIEWMTVLKQHFDPHWILNPGVLIPCPTKNKLCIQSKI